MIRITFLLCILLLSSCESKKQVVLKGEFGDGGWYPMWDKYLFENDSSFKYYSGDDLYGYFGRGTYSLSRNRLRLKFDHLILDKPQVMFFESNDSDSLTMEFELLEVPLQEIITVEHSGNIIIQNIVEEYPLKLKIKRPIERLTIKVDYYRGINKDISFEIETSDFSYMKVEYYPSTSWYRFNELDDEKFKLYNLTDSTFKLRNNGYNWVYKK